MYSYSFILKVKHDGEQLKLWDSQFVTNSPKSHNNVFRVDTIPAPSNPTASFKGLVLGMSATPSPKDKGCKLGNSFIVYIHGIRYWEWYACLNFTFQEDEGYSGEPFREFWGECWTKSKHVMCIRIVKRVQHRNNWVY